MHLMIPFACQLSDGCLHTVRDLNLPHLSRLLARLSLGARDPGDESSLSPPHERARAAALGLRGADGCLPWAARLAAADGIAVGDAAWGLLTPAHWQLATDHVILSDSAQLHLDEAASSALLRSLRPLFEGDGWRVEWGAPLRWYVAHEALRELPCASLDRVVGRSVDAWLPTGARHAIVRRLQSEAQMLLYHDPVNAEREAGGALPVNSFWLSGCGAHQVETLVPDLWVDDGLRAGALTEDWASWAEAWRALDAGGVRDLLRAVEGGAAAALTLAGERHALRYESLPQAWWPRLTRTWRTPAVAPVLETL